MAVSKETILAQTGEFDMTFTKQDGTQRTGKFTVAKDQRKVSNKNIVTLVENGNFRSVDATRVVQIG